MESRRDHPERGGCCERLPSPVDLGREICGELSAAEQREWLVTNGIGGFASGTVACSLTRRYHGLLVAALSPPLGRTLLVSKADETAEYDEHIFHLGTNRWSSGIVDPAGYEHLERFHLETTGPVWTWACADALLEKRIWMEQGKNTTHVRYDLRRARQPLRLTIKVLVNYRDYHSQTHAADWRMLVEEIENGLRVEAFPGAVAFYLLSDSAAAKKAHVWYRNFDLTVERYRGLNSLEDHLHAATFYLTLDPGKASTLTLTTESQASIEAPLADQITYYDGLLRQWEGVDPATAKRAPAWIRQLVLAADQFVVRRHMPGNPDARSIIAGYHWFGDWGRDTMIALPGLTLVTGRFQVARQILQTFSRFVNQGMLPNAWPESGVAPEYNTVDAALWYFQAVREYWRATRDTTLLGELYPVLAEIIDCYSEGTRYDIHVDPTDGLLYAGEPTVQLTWMDAKVGDWVVTPRVGKAVEVNALWLNALETMCEFALELGKPMETFQQAARRASEHFQRFWNENDRCCFDVIDGPSGLDSSVRPNQIFAVSLPISPLSPEQQRLVVDLCARHLLTSHGLRSLAPGSVAYRGRYGGSPRERDGAYHQGTVWGWLLGPFALAHFRVYGNASQAVSFLAPMAHHLTNHGLGSASEIFDADPPFASRGCIAQAWTVAEVLRAWFALTHEAPDSFAASRL